MVVLADRKSVLQETLDPSTPMQATREGKFYRTAKRAARQNEQDVYTALHLVDTWPLIYDPLHPGALWTHLSSSTDSPIRQRTNRGGLAGCWSAAPYKSR